jgi:glycosyltransferase involved in cell wall biosynthesis
VIVATYGPPTFVSAALKSVLAQTFDSFEVLVGDDSADPHTRAVVEDLADPRVHYHPNPQVLGVAENHWVNFRRARGRYITILNHDDLWEPDFLAVMTGKLSEQPGTVLAFCDHHIVDVVGRRLVTESDRVSAIWKRDQLAPGVHRPFFALVADQVIPVAMGTVLRRDAIVLSELTPLVGPAYDLWLAYLLSRGGQGACFVRERLTSWRQHGSNISTAASFDWVAGIAYCWERIAADPIFAAYRALLEIQVGLALVARAKAHLRKGDPLAARRDAVRALALRQDRIRAVAMVLLSFLPDALVQRILKRR